MIFPSLSLNLNREASFFSKKTASIIKNAIKPPKKVANAYSIFYMEKYPEFKNANMKVTEISKELGKQWKDLSSESKSNFLAKAEKLKLKYNSDLGAFKQALNEKEKMALDLLNLNRRAQNGKITRNNLDAKQKEFLKSLPEPLATTPRGVFLSQRLKGVSAAEIKPSHGLSEAMKEWSNLSSKDQETFAQQAQQNLKKYSEIIAEFLKK